MNQKLVQLRYTTGLVLSNNELWYSVLAGMSINSNQQLWKEAFWRIYCSSDGESREQEWSYSNPMSVHKLHLNIRTIHTIHEVTLRQHVEEMRGINLRIYYIERAFTYFPSHLEVEQPSSVSFLCTGASKRSAMSFHPQPVSVSKFWCKSHYFSWKLEWPSWRCSTDSCNVKSFVQSSTNNFPLPDNGLRNCAKWRPFCNLVQKSISKPF